MHNDLTMVLRVVLALILGAVIGWEREREGKEAGLRTHMLICVGATLFTLVSVFAFDGDPRIAAGVVTGVGFLGAGAILKSEGGTIKGLTTAASVWVAAAIGLAVGTGMYLISVTATLLSLFVLLFHPRIAHLIDGGKSKK